ncbi:transglycosylase domain-containing protein [Bradyrhizobium stylosanthis]|uniref:transglycosylase domain-containing protein n=1 Tax=Bradyrhizobium stylosanthis TaxID=1803665 RepID=UPI003D322D9C
MPILLQDLPDAQIKATLATEDRHLYDYVGIDIPRALHALLVATQNGARDQDDFSISQQIARTFLLNPGPALDTPSSRRCLRFGLNGI